MACDQSRSLTIVLIFLAIARLWFTDELLSPTTILDGAWAHQSFERL